MCGISRRPLQNMRLKAQGIQKAVLMMEKKHTDEKNYLSVRIKWCALLAAGLVGAFLVRMWVVCIREMQSLMVPAVFTALSAALAVIVYPDGADPIPGDSEDL